MNLEGEELSVRRHADAKSNSSQQLLLPQSKIHRLESQDGSWRSGQGAVIVSLLLSLLLRLFRRRVFRRRAGKDSGGFKRGQRQAERSRPPSAVLGPRGSDSARAFRGGQLAALAGGLERLVLHLLHRRVQQLLQLRLDQVEKRFVPQAGEWRATG